MNLNAQLYVMIAVQLVTAGVFIGVVQTSLKGIGKRLERIEEKQDMQNNEISELKSRVAVIETVLEIKTHK